MQKSTGKLLRELGLKEALAIGLGTMIGAGIFVLPGIAVARAGQAAGVSYLIAGLILLPVALIISELATGIPHAGGSYTFIAEALGPLAGSIVGPANWLGLTFANGFYLIAAGQYLNLFVPIPPWVAALGFGLLFVFLNYRGAKMSGSVQNLVVLVLIVILVLFIILGVFQSPKIPRESFPINGWAPVIGSVGLIIVSYTGFEKISTISEEVKQPGKTLPLAIIGSVVIATLLYVLLVFISTGLMPPGDIDPQRGLLVEAASLTFGSIGGIVMSIAALLATLSSANAATMASSRISYGMGRDLVFPGWFGKTHPQYKTPGNGILVTGGIAVLLAMTGRAEILAEISSALFMVSYALLSLSLIVMRRVKPRWYQPSFHAPLFPFLPVVAIILCLSVILTMDEFSQIAGISLVILSLGWYFLWVRKKAVVTGEFGPLWERERPMERIIEAVGNSSRKDQNIILVPYWGREDPILPLSLASAIAYNNEEMVVNLLNLIVTPPQVSLDVAQSALERRDSPLTSSISEAVGQEAKKGVPIRIIHRAVRSADTGIVAYHETHPQISLVLTGWKGSLSSSRIYDSPVKRILEKTPCDIGIILPKNYSTIERILIPVGGGPHARLGLRLAWQFAKAKEAQLTALRVLRPGPELDMEVETEGFQRVLEDILDENAAQVSPQIIVDDNVINTILKTAKDGKYDLLVIGASEEWQVKSLLAGSLPDAIADQSPCSVLLTRRYEPVNVSTTRRILSSFRGWN